MTPFRPPAPPRQRRPFSWLFRRSPYLARRLSISTTIGGATFWTSLPPLSVSFDSPFPPLTAPAPFPFFPFPSPPPFGRTLQRRTDERNAVGERKWQQQHGAGRKGGRRGERGGKGEAHLQHRLNVAACISPRLAQKVRWRRPEGAITCFDIKTGGRLRATTRRGRKRPAAAAPRSVDRWIAAAVGKATNGDRAAHEAQETRQGDTDERPLHRAWSPPGEGRR